jgi:hypothetical protein
MFTGRCLETLWPSMLHYIHLGLQASAFSIQVRQNKNSGTNWKNGTLGNVTIYQAYDIRSHRSVSIIGTGDKDKLVGILQCSINYFQWSLYEYKQKIRRNEFSFYKKKNKRKCSVF